MGIQLLMMGGVPETFNSNSSSNALDNRILKLAWQIGSQTVIVLDKSIVESLHINEDTLFEENLTDDGILIRIISDRNHLNRKTD